MTNLRSLSKLFRAVIKLAAACAFATAMAAAASAQTNTFPTTGNAGIGTTAPTEPLEINKNQNAGTTLAVDNGYTSAGNAAYSGFWFRQGGASRFFLGAVNDGNTTQVGGPGAAQFWNFANGPMLFATNSSERMRITSAGNVGIGTASPASRFDIKQSSDTFVGGLHLRRSSTNDTWALATGEDNSLYMGYANNASGADAQSDFTVYPLVLTGAGNVGIGTSSPNAKLHVAAGDSSFALFGPNTSWSGSLAVGSGSAFLTPISGRAQVLSSNGNLHLDAGTNQFVYIGWLNASNTIINGQGGNVGIGTSTPNANYRLDVNGEINATGIRINGTPISGGGSSQWGGTSGNPIYYTGGNVGVGTDNPSLAKLQVAGSNGSVVAANIASGYGDIGLYSAGTYKVALGYAANNQNYGVQTLAGDVSLKTNNSNLHLVTGAGNANTTLYLSNGGHVGIGNASPTEKLHVTGNGKFTGNLTVDGTVNAKYQDLAEWVPSSEQLSAGTVVVLDTTKSNQVIASGTAYDTRVAGVISAQPGITLGESGEGKVLVATTGRVRVKVDASGGAIQIGDLLVTSDVSGVAMKSEAVNLGGVQVHRPGTIIGKALEPLAKGKGEILVLLSLQ